MKIVHVVAYFNEYWKYQENYLAEVEVLEGHEVHIIGSNLNFPYPDYNSTSALTIGPRKKKAHSFFNGAFHIHYLPVKLELSGRVWLKGLEDKIRSIEPDLIICHGVTQPALFQLCFLKPIPCPIIADEHMLFSDIEHSKLKQQLLGIYGRLSRDFLSARVKKFIGIAEGSKIVLEKVLRFPAQKITMIPLGTDTHIFKPDSEAGYKFREKYSIAHNKTVIGYTGKIEPRKQLEVLIRVLTHDAFKNTHLLIVGNMEGNYANFLKTELINLTIGYTLLPSQPQSALPDVYNACDLLVWPAHQTISMMDAASCGKPFICSEFLQERLQENQGIGIKPGNELALKNALLRLVKQPEERIAMGENARNWALKSLSWVSVNRRVLEI